MARSEMMFDALPPKLWMPPKPAVIRAASPDDVKRAMPLLGTFGAASAGGFRSKGGVVPPDANTKLLLHCDGADASTTFTDSSLSPHTVVAVANAQVDTAQSKFGGASYLGDGTGDYLRLDGSADFAFGTGDFTVDFWFRFNSVAMAFFLDFRPAGTEGAYPCLYYSSGLKLYVAGADCISGTTLSTSTWYHIALERYSGTSRLFLNGTQTGANYTDGNSYLNPASRPIIGAGGETLGGNSVNGWIDEFRISNVARYLGASFTPPAAPY
jgi:hypothetical protein